MDKLAEILGSWGPVGVFFLAVLDSAGVPIPAGVDALLVTVAAVNPPVAYGSAALGVIGSIVGNLFLFSLARKGGEAYLRRRADSKRLTRSRRWFQHYGLIAVFVPTVVPVVPLPLKMFVILAGALGVRMRSFVLVILAGRIPRFLGMAYLGSQLGGDSAEWLRQHAWHLAGVAVALSVFLFALVKFADYRRRVAAELG